MITATNPHTGEVIRERLALKQPEREAAVAAASEAVPGWKATPIAERAARLVALAEQLRARQEKLAALATEEMGKPITEARAEVEKAASCAEHYAENAARYLEREVIASDAVRSYVCYEPLGCLLGIMPWNFPFWLPLRFGAPALMAGNTCLLKPDPHVPGCTEMLADAFAAAGLPTGVWQSVAVANQDISDLIANPQVAAVSFTGSTSAGAAVAGLAAHHIKKTVLELGGSDPAIVLADADLEAAAIAITHSRVINSGQSCVAAKRIIVEDPVHDDFVALLEKRLRAETLGDPRDENTTIGPIARGDLRDLLHRQVVASVEAGARCLLGGTPCDGRGFYYPATLLTEVTALMPVAAEETFGPVAAVMRAADTTQALQLANHTAYGLAASIWTQAARGEALAQFIEAGQVVVNGVVKTDPRLPSGGVKASGYGRELGGHGIREFVNAKQVWVGS